MKKRSWIFIIFLCLAIIQVTVVVSRIIKWENILRNGKEFRFKTIPVDPYDAFRGRYISLDFEAATLPLNLVPEEGDLESNQRVFALLENDAAGFAQINSLTLDEPEDADYLRARIGYRWDPAIEKRRIHLQLPFTRFYVAEKIAPAAEETYREYIRRKGTPAYATVRLRNGYGVLEEVYIDGKPLVEFIREARQTDND